MARTRTPRNALNVLKKAEFRNLDDAGFALLALNEALKMMWRGYDWRESLVELPPFYMVPEDPEVSVLQAPLPSDYWYLKQAWLHFIGGDTRPLEVVQYLPVSARNGQPTSIGLIPEKDTFRLHPTPVDGSPWVQVEGLYKKTPTLYTNDDWEDPLPWDDQYFDVFLACLRYKYHNLLGNPQAGQVQYVNGFPQFTGALAAYQSLLEDAKADDTAARGQRFIAPAEGLALG